MEKELIDYLKEVGGKPHDLTWEQVGQDFGLSARQARYQWDKYGGFSDVREKEKNLDISSYPGLEEIKLLPGMKITKQWGDKNKMSISAEVSKDHEYYEDVVKRFEEILTKYKPRAPRINYNPDTSEDILVVATSDKHVGAKVQDNTYRKDLVYNEKVFRDRMFFLAKNIVARSRLVGGFKELVIFDLGDAVDGWDQQTTRGGHKLPQNMTNEEMFDVYVKVHLDFFEFLVGNNVASRYSFYGASNSNHGGSQDYVCMQALHLLLSATYGDIYEGVVSTDFVSCVKLVNRGKTYNYFYTHGKDKVDRKKGMPFHLDVKNINYINDMVDYWKANGEHTSFIKGDLHQFGYEKRKKFSYVNVPSIMGSSAWVVNNGIETVGVGAYMEHISDFGVTSSFIEL